MIPCRAYRAAVAGAALAAGTLAAGTLAAGCDARPPARDAARTDAVSTAHAMGVVAPAATPRASTGAVDEQTFRLGEFGTVHVLHASGAPLAGTAPAHTVVSSPAAATCSCSASIAGRTSRA